MHRPGSSHTLAPKTRAFPPHSLPRRARSARLWVAASLSAAALAPGCSSGPSHVVPRVPVTVGVATQRDVPYEIAANGTVEPRQTAAVGSQVGGVVTRVAFREGEEVAAGQLLFQLDPKPFDAALEQARGVLARDRAQAANARSQAERAQKLFEQNLIAAQEAEDKRTAAEALEAQVRADSAAVADARLNRRYANIEAPIAGRSGSLLVHRGDYVKANTTDPLVTINQIRPILVRFSVPESQLPMIQRYRGRKLVVRVKPTERDSAWIQGALVFVDNAVDRSTGTLLLKGEFPNRDGALWPGEFVSVRLQLFVEPNACVVPAPAVTNGPNGPYVYVVNRDSTVTPRPVKVARGAGDLAVIASGVHPGEQVVTDGQMRLAPGARVEIKSAAPGASPGGAAASAAGAGPTGTGSP